MKSHGIGARVLDSSTAHASTCKVEQLDKCVMSYH